MLLRSLAQIVVAIYRQFETPLEGEFCIKMKGKSQNLKLIYLKIIPLQIYSLWA